MIRLLDCLKKSNRIHHFIIGFISALLSGFVCSILVGCAMEGKDCQNDRLNAPYGLDFRKWIWRRWDWVDFACTVAGGLVGSVLRWWMIGRFM